MNQILEAAARAFWESEEDRPWDSVPADERADLQRDLAPIVRAVLASLAALPADERDRMLREAR